MKFKMKLPLDGSSTDVSPPADGPHSPGLGTSALATLPMQIPSVCSYSSPDSVAGSGSGSDSGSKSKSGSGLEPGSRCGSSIGSVPGSCSFSGSISRSGSCSSPRSGSGSEFGSGLGSGDSDRPAKDSSSSGASAPREVTSSETVVCAGPAQLSNGLVPPPFLAPPTSPANTANTNSGCHATRSEWNPAAKTAAAAAAAAAEISTFDPCIASIPCSKPNEVSAAADMVERAGQLAADGAKSAGVISGEGYTVRNPAQAVVEEDEGRKTQEEVGKKRYAYILIVGPGTQKKVRIFVSACLYVYGATLGSMLVEWGWLPR